MIDLKWVKKMRAASRQAATRFNGDERNRAMLKSERKGDEPPYNGATFLFVRAFDGDAGARPFAPGTVCWLSPDIELFDPGGVRVATTEIKAGTTYTVEVVVSNGGDLDCNVCQVELYLDDPSIGFSVAASKLIGNKVTAVPRQSTATVSFPFAATAETAGHRCMFARVSSFMTNDLPVDWTAFNAWIDRHLGQQNLNIVQQGKVFEFNVHLVAAFRDKGLALTLEPNARPFKKARFAALGRYLLVNRAATPAAFAIARKEFPHVAMPPPGRVGRPGRTAPAGGVPGVPAAVAATLAPLAREEKNRWAFRSKLERETMRIDIPQLGLRPNEALPMELRLTDPATGQVIGGITLLVVS